MPARTLRARLLGTFEVEIDGRRVDRATFERPSGLRLLKLLLASPGHRVRREAAAELLWPDADPVRSSANLRKAIHFARRAIAPEAPEDAVIAGDGESLRFNPALDLDVDLDRLVAALERVELDDVEVIADLGGHELLPEDPYEEWLVPIRERLRQRVQAVLQRALVGARSRGEVDVATRLIELALRLDPADETAHRAAIELHLEAGRMHAARRQLLACRQALADAYGVEPAVDLAAMIEASARTRPGEAVPADVEPPIIGRRLELEAAEATLDEVAAGRRGALLLRGGPGIGKSRLLRELVRSAEAGGWRILELRGLEFSSETAFAALGGSLGAIVDPALVATWPEPARSAVLAIAPGLAGHAHDPGAAAPSLSFASDAALRAGLVDVLGRLAAERPLVLAVDDAQWLDRPTVALLGGVLLGLAGRPVLVLLTLRDEPTPPPGEVAGLVADLVRVGGSELRLGPLGEREIRLVLEREVGGERLGDDVAVAIGQLSGGAPLYALELLRGAEESGAIAVRDGQWRLTTTSTALPVPAGVRRLVEERANRLAPGVQAILAVAAELGDEVTYELLVAAADADAADVLDALDAGLAVDLLVERAGSYRFGHPLFRAGLRSRAPRKARAELHHRIALALSAGLDPADEGAIRAAVAAGLDAQAVATHAAHAADLGRVDAVPLAVGFGFAGGARQFALFDLESATATLRRATGWWYRLPAERRPAFPAAAAQMQLGLALKGMGDPGGASEAFRGAAAVAATDLDRARAFAALSWMPYEHGDFTHAEEILVEGIGQVGEPVARAYLESGLGWIRGRRGDWHAARALLERAVAVLDSAAPPDILARSMDRFAVSIRDTGAPLRSLPVFERAMRLSIEAANAHEESIIRMHYAGALREVGELDAAREQIERALAICVMTGDRYIEAVTTWIAAEVADAAGDLTEAIRLRRSELGILGATGGNPQNQAMAHSHIAHLAARLRDPAQSAEAAAAARRAAGHSGIEHLNGMVERALSADDWFSVAHRSSEDPDATASAMPPGT